MTLNRSLASLVMLILVATGLFLWSQATPGSEPELSTEQVVQQSCRGMVAELIDRAGGGVEVHQVSDVFDARATWEEYAGLTRIDQRRAHQDILDTQEGAASLYASRRSIYENGDWYTHTAIVTLDRGFRSSQTLENRVVCTVVTEGGHLTADRPPPQRHVYVSGANLLDYALLGLRL